MMKTALIRGIQTQWLESGPESSQGPILFFLHGFPDSPEAWSSQIEHFQSQYTVVVPNLCGTEEGPSKPQSRFAIGSTVLDLLEILSRVDPTSKRKVMIVAHDIGGLYAWPFALRLTSRLHSLVFINSLGLPQMLRHLGQWDQMKKSWYIGFFQVPYLSEWVFQKWGSHFIREERNLRKSMPLIQAYREALRETPRLVFQKKEHLNAPFLVLWGNHDPYLKVPSLKELRNHAPQVTLRVLEGGHWLQKEKAEQVNTVLEKWIPENPTMRGSDTHARA